MGCCNSVPPGGGRPTRGVRNTSIRGKHNNIGLIDARLLSSEVPEFLEEYELTGKLIGEGEFGIVVACRKRLNDNGKIYAAKILTKDTKVKRKQIMSELEGGSLSRHQNVMAMVDSYECKSKTVLIYQYFTGGEVCYALSGRTFYSEETVGVIIKGLTRAVTHLHNNGVAHMDIKPSNILLAQPGTDDRLKASDIKLIDFGSLTRFTKGKSDVTAIAGTPYFAAPEIVIVYHLGGKGTPFDERCDVWSIGILAYILLTGKHPFQRSSYLIPCPEELFAGILYDKFTLPNSLSQEAKSFLIACLTRDFRERARSSELLEHPWLAGQPDEEVACNSGTGIQSGLSVLSGNKLAMLTSHLSHLSAATTSLRFPRKRQQPPLTPRDLPNVDAVPEVDSEALSSEYGPLESTDILPDTDLI